ncbi:hypothetical protein [Halocynthiibacter namhaensis]|uniref:hypothetical protein n=1 Tax=Halocynthiibacter namhaensis TaxID=1290553 RepID=UPI00068E0152|nr:hypothetical protein [Halocynthiibacter namhaensis]
MSIFTRYIRRFRHIATGVCFGLITAPPLMADNFTTAGEVRPILTATRSSWVSLRADSAQDVLDFTQIAAWRCGLSAVHYRINGGSEKSLDLEACYESELRPNATKNRAVWLVNEPGGSVDRVDLRLIYDDGREDSIQVNRASIQR